MRQNHVTIERLLRLVVVSRTESYAGICRQNRESAHGPTSRYSDHEMSEADSTTPSPPPAPSFSDRLKGAPVTMALTAINFAWFLWAEKHGSTQQTKILLEYGAVEKIHVWSGEYWRVASYMFLHIGWIHILWNTWASFSLCSMMERAFGWWRYLFVYLASGIGGGCVAAILSPAPTVTAGASGAMFGIVGALLVVRYHQLGSLGAFFEDPGVRSMLFQIGLWTAILTYSTSVSNAAHAGGFVVGAGATFTILRKSTILRFALGVGMIALLIGAFRPGWRPNAEDEKLILDFAGGYMDHDETLPDDPARGERIAKKACSIGITEACERKPGHGKQL